MPFVDQDTIALSEQGYALCVCYRSDCKDQYVQMLMLNNPPGHSVPEHSLVWV